MARSNVAALDATTGEPLNWHPRVGGTVYSIAVSGSRVYLGGAFTSVGGAVRDHLAAVSTAGALTGWNPHADSTVNVVRVGPNGNVFVGGRFGRIGGVTRSRVAEITPGGSLTAWAPQVAQLTGFACPPRCTPVVFAIAFSPAGRSVYLAAAGCGTTSPGRPQPCAVRRLGGARLTPTSTPPQLRQIRRPRQAASTG